MVARVRAHQQQEAGASSLTVRVRELQQSLRHLRDDRATLATRNAHLEKRVAELEHEVARTKRIAASPALLPVVKFEAGSPDRA